MKPVISKYGRGLLPGYFKIVGIAVIALTFAGMIIFRSFIMQHADQKALAKSITMNVILIGLFLIAWTRDKIEDEMSIHLRFQSMALSFLFGVMYCIIHPVVNVIIGDTDYDLPGQQLVMAMLIFFIIIFAIRKKSTK